MAEGPVMRHVLIVDDSPEDRESVRRYLAQDVESTYRFREAASGQEAIAACAAEVPDCLLLDYDLPDLDGLEVLDAVMGHPVGPAFPVVMLTGQGSEVVAVKSLKRGAQDYLVKGHFTPEGLRRTVDDAIAKVVTARTMEGQRVELERLYREARETDRRKDEFLAMLAHELRNPLAPILNAVHVMRLRPGDLATLGRMRDMVERQVRHLARLVDDLLDASRIARGKITLRREPVDLASAVSQAVEAVQPAVDERRHHLSVSLPERPVRLDADPTRLGQVLVNLLSNAVKYTDPMGSIDLSAGVEGGDAVISVRDSGVGIAQEMLPRVFDLFAQADLSLDRSQGGLGIGLTLVRLLVELHGGTASAASAGPGQGSEFTIRLPLPAFAPSADPPGPDRDDEADARPRRVLIVEDNTASAESLSLLIGLMGHETRVAHAGIEALAVASGYRPDVVLLDIGLPGIDGYDVARALRVRPEHREALIVAVTGYGQDEDRARTREAGFDDHLVKPIDFDRLADVLDGRVLGVDGRAKAGEVFLPGR